MENSSITRQAVLTLGGKAPTNGTVTATKGYEFASVRTNVRVTSQRPVSTDIEFLVDVHVTERRTLAPGEGSIQLEFDFTKIVEGMPAFTVAVPPSLCGHYEAEFQLTIVERPATRQRVITGKGALETVLPAPSGCMFQSMGVDVYLAGLWSPEEKRAAGLGPELEINGLSDFFFEAVQGSRYRSKSDWLLCHKGKDLSSVVKDKTEIKISFKCRDPNVAIMLRFDLATRQFASVSGVALLSNSQRSVRIGNSVDVIRAASLKLSCRGPFSRMGETLHLYVGGEYFQSIMGRADRNDTDWEQVPIANPGAFLPNTIGNTSVDIFAIPSGQSNWEVKVEHSITVAPGQATIPPAHVAFSEIAASGRLTHTFKGPPATTTVFIAPPLRTLRLKSLRPKSWPRTGAGDVWSMFTGLRKFIRCDDAVDITERGKGRSFLMRVNAADPKWEMPVELDVEVLLAFNWQSTPDLRQRVVTMQGNTERIKGGLVSLEESMATTIAALGYAEKVRDGLSKLESGLRTLNDLLGLAELVPALKTGAQQLRKVVKQTHDSVKYALGVAESVEKAVKPIRESLVKGRRWVGRLVLITERMIEVEAATARTINAAKDCIDVGDYAEGKVTAANALEQTCTSLTPAVEAVDNVQKTILNPFQQIEYALNDLRQRIGVLGTIHVKLESILNALDPMLAVLRHLEVALNAEIMFVSLRDILSGINSVASWILEQAEALLKPITDLLSFDIKLEIPGLDLLGNLINISLDPKFELGSVELDQLFLKWNTDFADLEAKIEPIRKSYLACCGQELGWRLFPPPRKYSGRQNLAIDGLMDPVVLCDDKDYGGASQGLGVGWHDLATLGFGDRVSSVRVDPAFRVTLFEHDGFRGSWKTFTRDEPNLVASGLNDQASSVVVEKLSDPTTWIGAMLFEDPKFAGSCRAIKVGWHDLAAIGLNDRVSSVKSPGCRVTLFEHSGFYGTYRQFDGEMPNLADHEFNDKASSVIVELSTDSETVIAAMLFETSDYAGNCQALRVGWHDTGSLRLNDKAQSMKVAPGIRVTLFEHEGFRGACLRLAFDSSLGILANRASSVIVERVADESSRIPALLFEHGNFEGISQALKVGWHDKGALYVGSDRVSSIKVAEGYRIWLFEDDGFFGAWTCLESGLHAALPAGWNDRASSVIVERLSDPRSHIPLLVFDTEKGKAQAMGVGSHDLGALKIGNDRISSVRVGASTKVTLYADSGFNGDSMQYMNTSSNPFPCTLVDFSQKASSLRVSSI